MRILVRALEARTTTVAGPCRKNSDRLGFSPARDGAYNCAGSWSPNNDSCLPGPEKNQAGYGLFPACAGGYNCSGPGGPNNSSFRLGPECFYLCYMPQHPGPFFVSDLGPKQRSLNKLVLVWVFFYWVSIVGPCRARIASFALRAKLGPTCKGLIYSPNEMDRQGSRFSSMIFGFGDIHGPKTCRFIRFR